LQEAAAGIVRMAFVCHMGRWHAGGCVGTARALARRVPAVLFFSLGRSRLWLPGAPG
jgi:hypothetical protein